MNNIIEEMKELYLKDSKHWVISFSGGKDSSMCLEYTFQMLLSLPREQRHKPVYVLMVNTMAETPMMSAFMERTMRFVQRTAFEKELPIVAETITPAMRDRFFFNTLGKGMLVISPKVRGRWCSHRMKITPAQKRIREIIDSSPFEPNVNFSLSSDGQLSLLEQDTTRIVQILGTRLDESAARAASIRSHEIKDTKFSRHSHFKDEILCYMPIKHMTSDELWLSLPSKFAWGIDVSELEVQYGGNFLECGMQDAGEEKKACGTGSRQGCWTCPAMGLNKDKMLEGLISEGHEKMLPLYEWKRQLIEMRNDVRYREFERRQWRNQHKKRLASFEEERQQVNLIGDYFNNGLNVSDYMNMKRQTEYEEFDKAMDEEYLPGGLSVEGRKLMLEKLLYIQQQTGFELIPEEEVQAIVAFWNEEGYLYSVDDVIPTNHSYDGALVLDKVGRINLSDTTTETPYFEIHVDFEDGRDSMVEFIESRKKKTGQSFYYFTTHCDLGAGQQFIWNQAIFIVCRPGITTDRQARRLIMDWLNPQLDHPQTDHSFPGYVKRKFEQVRGALQKGEVTLEELTYLKRLLIILDGFEPVLEQEYHRLLNAIKVGNLYEQIGG